MDSHGIHNNMANRETHKTKRIISFRGRFYIGFMSAIGLLIKYSAIYTISLILHIFQYGWSTILDIGSWLVSYYKNSMSASAVPKHYAFKVIWCFSSWLYGNVDKTKFFKQTLFILDKLKISQLIIILNSVS